ncbi:Tad domain-containing protein [Nakamurella sp. PAMC28650]|uniref:Tad domain-containing protein n=1 Tax=Nakamurella sp. PAMC28650 TaxID=2762325 RepID=UPI00164EB35F|nr:Tad domain-containing protein [Nakamurella sp. PAMC28650]QNK80584.1 Tad domain-containing protein [Nakamurella sp. PAMC28650]
MNTTDPPTPTNRPRDEGSITPLVLGMMVCLLVLGAGITAAGSAFLAGQRLQHLCDGAASTAAGTLTDNPANDQTVINAVNGYLAVRRSTADTTANLVGTTLTLTCSDTVPIAFGALFGSPTLHRTVTATARTAYSRT